MVCTHRILQATALVGMIGLSAGWWTAAAGAAARQDQPVGNGVADEVVNRARGEEALAEARAHMQAGRYAQAIDAFATALRYLPGNEEATRGMQEAQIMLNRGGIAERVEQDIDVLRGQALAEFDTDMQMARERLAQSDFEAAERMVVVAKVKLDSNRQLLGEAEYSRRASDSTTLLSQIRQRRDQEELRARQKAEEDARTAKAEAERAQRAQRQAMIDENLRRVRQLQAEMKYDEALQVIEQILVLDPLNPAALALRDALEPLLLYMRFQKAERTREMRIGELRTQNQEATIAPRDIMEYPDDWKRLSLNRYGEGGWQESPGDRRVSQVLTTKRLPTVDLEGVTLAQAMDFMSQASGVNLYVDWKALEAIGVQRNEPINLRLGEVPVGHALQRILEQVGDFGDRPQYDIQDGIVTVSSERALRRKTVTLVYDIRDLLFEVPQFDNAPQLNLGALTSGSGQAGGGAFGSHGSPGSAKTGLFSDDRHPAERRSREEIVGQIVDLITNTIDFDGWDANGGDTGRVQELNGNLIVTNTLANQRSVEGLLSQLREIRALQINVEARFLNVSNDWFEQIGFDLDLYFNTNGSVWERLQAADPNAHLSDLFPGGLLADPLIFGNGVTADGVNTGPLATGSFIGVPVTPITSAAGNPLFSDITYVGGPVGAPIRTTQGFAPIGLPQRSYGANGSGLVNAIADLGLTSIGGLSAAAPAISLGVQFLDDIQVDLLIQATQADKRSVVLTAPRVTFFNGQRAWVAVTTQQYFATSLTAVSGDLSLGFIPVITPQFEGVVLDVEAVISSDRRYVTLTVVPSIAEIVSTKLFTAVGAVGSLITEGTGGTGGTAIANSFETPIISVQQVQTTVSVPDKGTALLGGQRRVREIEVEVGVPILSKIPIINRFFTNRLKQKEEATLLILIRPEIIIQQENEDRLFPGLADQLRGGGSAYIQ